MQWQCDIESRTLTLHAFYPDVSSMPSHQLIDQIQSDTQSTYRTIQIARTVKTLVDVRKFICGNANTMIAYPDESFIGILLCKTQAYFDFFMVGTILHSIIHEIIQRSEEHTSELQSR